MAKDRDFSPGVKLPSTWTDAIEELLSTYASPNFTITPASATQIQIVAGSGVDQVCVEVAGRPRWIAATVTAAHPGGAAGTHDIYVTGYANSFSLDGSGYEIDGTNRAFGLKIVTSGTPSGTGAEAIYRKVGTLTWSGSAITGINQTVHQVTTSQILDGTIVNADINASAAIARTKLDFGSGLVDADIASGAAIARSKLSFGSGLVNADIAAAAAIVRSKLDFGTGLTTSDLANAAGITLTQLAAAVQTAINDPGIVGDLKWWAGASAPSAKWLQVLGQSLLRASYPELFGVLGTTFGAVDGTHFSLPSPDRVLIPSGGTYARGATGGEVNHTLTPAETALREHRHDLTASDAGGGSLPTMFNDDGRDRVTGSIAGAPGGGTIAMPLYAAAYPYFWVLGVGGLADGESNGAAHNNMQPWLGMPLYIRATP